MKTSDTADRKHASFSDRRELPKYTIIILIVLYELITRFISAASHSDNAMIIGRNVLPVSAFSGVLSAITNVLIILMVILYRKLGVITSLILLIIQDISLIMYLLSSHNLSSIPGLFISITTIITILIIHFNQTRLEKEQKRLRKLFEETATALVNAIDAKDSYTHGHSARVAEYSRRIAQLSGKSPRECDEIYYTALLHDVGKIGIPGNIINKNGKLTEEEYDLIKEHPAMGAQILENIKEYPFLSIGAHYHHERYDGKGYPDGLKDNDIPDIARIISVADAYDAMTSKRSYRDPIPQLRVREEIVMGMGTQFDPEFARLMLRLIDADTKYEMKEGKLLEKFERATELNVEEYRSAVAEGVIITPFMSTIRFSAFSDDEATGIAPVVSMILFDSFDGCVHSRESEIKNLNYFEYGEIWLDGRNSIKGARKMETQISDSGSDEITMNGEYIIEAVRVRDHALIRVTGKEKTIQTIVALPDKTRYAYIGLTGSHCHIRNLDVKRADVKSPSDLIPRIAEEISYIDVPEGDIPNVQVDGYRTDHTEGIPLKESLHISFHTKNLPTAGFIWHCPFLVLYHSARGEIERSDYREYALIKLDGENMASDEHARTSTLTVKGEDFPGWDAWKAANMEGIDCEITVEKKGNRVSIKTENLGISVEALSTIIEERSGLYVALTGDQVVLSNIRISSQ